MQEPATNTRSLAGEWRLRDENPNEWIVRKHTQKKQDLSTWQPVPVPAAVQDALEQAGVLPELYRDLNTRLAEWTEHRDWIYGLDFDLAPPRPGERVFIEFESVDDACRVYLNQKLAGQHEGPGAPFSVEIGDLLQDGGNQLTVLIDAVRKEDPQIGWTEHTQSLKGRLGYSMDFSPRLVKTGILGDVRLRFIGAHRLLNLWAHPQLSADLSSATVALQVEVDGPAGAVVRFAVLKDGQRIAEAEASADDGIAEAQVEIPEPQLWWPNGLGEQPLYRALAECVDGSDSASTTFGLRQIRWLRRPDGTPDEWPMLLEVNGRQVFQKGWNWVPGDMMGGPRGDAQMRRLLALAQDAGVNILRVWGGADPETAAFYDECDRRGILAWQEFPLCSGGINNVPPGDPAYLERLKPFAREVVFARRNHPSLALWGGGNELRGPDDLPLRMDHIYAQVLSAAIEAADPGRGFRPSSPLGPSFEADPEQPALWDVHGPWEYSERWPGAQYWRFNTIAPIIHSEVGVAGEASLEAQARFLSPDQRSRDPEHPVRRHHSRWWELRDTLDRVFGPSADDELAVLASQWQQAEALRYVVEETRRRWPISVGVFPWQFNEPWPMSTCTSAVEYGGTPKLAYYAVKGAYRPRIATAHYAGLKLAPGEPLRFEVWTLNELADADADLRITLRDLDGHDLAAPQQLRPHLAANSSALQANLSFDLPHGFEGAMLLELTLDGAPNRYLFSSRQERHLAPALSYPQLLRDMFT